MNSLPVTGTSRLLDVLDPYVPDDFINQHWNARPVRGPRWQFSAAQLWRVHLLALLTPVHSLNLLTAMLPEQRAWRGFARLRHRHRVPDARILNAFRLHLGVMGLRQINDTILQPLIQTKTWKGLKASRKSRLVRFSRSVSSQFTLACLVWNLGNLIHRTRIKMAARMLNFTEYGDFAHYFGPRWHYYLGATIAQIPIPFKFGKGDFEKGVAVRILNEYAENPYAYLDEKGKKQLVAADGALLQKFTDLAFDESAEMRWRESERAEADKGLPSFGKST